MADIGNTIGYVGLPRVHTDFLAPTLNSLVLIYKFSYIWTETFFFFSFYLGKLCVVL